MSDCIEKPPPPSADVPSKQAENESASEKETPAKLVGESTMMSVHNLVPLDNKEDVPKDTNSPGNLGHFNGFNVSRVKKVKLEGTGKYRLPPIVWYINVCS